MTVDQSSLLKNAVQIAVSNVHSKRKRKLWVKKRKNDTPAIPKREISAIQKQFKQEAPWTPWARKEVPNG